MNTNPRSSKQGCGCKKRGVVRFTNPKTVPSSVIPDDVLQKAIEELKASKTLENNTKKIEPQKIDDSNKQSIKNDIFRLFSRFKNM